MTGPNVGDTKVADIYHELSGFGVTVAVYDPGAIAAEVAHECNISPARSPEGTRPGIVP